MVVDDSEFVLEQVRFVLEGAGHTVLTRESALGTLPAVLKARPDVLILDIGMPALDGGTLARLVLDADPSITIVLYSGRNVHELAAATRKSGAHGYLQKTGDMDAFVADFERLAQRRRVRPAAPGRGV
jgi:DNA-binding NarL/FixJ family response regulator